MTQNSLTELVSKVICPNCWQTFAPEDTCWIAAHQELTGSPRLGTEAQQRFVPSRFTSEGLAIDTRGLTCQDLGCPHCHLRIPRSILFHRPFFISIAGAPACGKSFLLASMAWQMRQQFPRIFKLTFTDADPEANRILNHYEDQLFVSSKPREIVKLSKTQETGDWYNEVVYDEQTVRYPQPFLFEVKPGSGHPYSLQSNTLARLICMYDNAGESFRPGKDTVVNAVTRHLGAANAWFFCFDPTQDPKFRKTAAGISNDVQIQETSVTSRQEVLFHEMLSRVKKHGNFRNNQRTNRPLVIICTKFDTWRALLPNQAFEIPIRKSMSKEIGIIELAKLKEISDRVQKLLNDYSPELVSAAQSFSSRVWFLPVSATGTSPVTEPNGQSGFRPIDIAPLFCELPVMVALAESTSGLIPISKK